MAKVIVPHLTAFDVELREALSAIERSLNGPDGQTTYAVRVLGTVANSGALPASPAVGDGWIANDTGHLWVWNGTAWVDCGSVRGTAGAQGPQGPVGPTGPAGEYAYWWDGTQAEYDAIVAKDPDVLYVITDGTPPLNWWVGTQAEYDALGYYDPGTLYVII